MRNFLKNNLISIVVCLFALGTISVGAPYVRPYTAANYAAGTRAIGSIVNAEFDSLKNWLNGGNISSQNIAALSITTDNIANSAIETANINDSAVTNAKLAVNSVSSTKLQSESVYKAKMADDVGQTSSTSRGGDFTTSSTGGTDVTGLTTTITVIKRPVIISITKGATTASSPFQLESTIAATTATVTIQRDGAAIFRQVFRLDTNYNTPGDQMYLTIPAGLTFLDDPGPGTYVYSVAVAVGNGTDVMTVARDVNIVAYEL